MKRLISLLVIILSVCLLFSGCSIINSVLDRWNKSTTEEDAPHTHSYTAVVTEPTETDGGYTTYTCSCGDSYVSDYTQMLGYYSKGFEFELSEDGSGYILTDIGECNDADIVIPSVHNGLPVVALGEYALCEFDFITSISIPGTITSIGEAAIAANINLKEIKISPDNAYYKVVDGALYTKDGKVLVQYATARPDTTFNIPSGVTEIALGAFAVGFNLENVTIPGTVTTIAESAFALCENLTEIIIPEGVTSIGDYAFEECTSLTNVVIPDSIAYIGSSAFSACDSLIYNEYDNAYYLGNDDNPFLALIDTKSNAIISCTIHSCTRLFAYYAFTYCSDLANIYVDSGNAYYQSIDGNLYTKDGKILIQYAAGKTDTSFTIPDGVTSIGDGAFYYCSSLTSITIPDSVTSIGDDAFYNCYSLTSITIPNSVTSIGDYAFDGCSRLTKITIPNSVIKIGDRAFYYCYGLTSVTIGNSVTSIGDYAFYGCTSLTSIEVNPNNAHYQSIDGNLYTKDGKTLILYASGKTDTSFTIPDGVTSIGKRAFYSCDNLTSITIPDSVTSIGNSAFYWCNSLTSITIPNSVISIGDEAFHGCDNLASISISGSVTYIGDQAFARCRNLTSIDVNPNNAHYQSIDGCLYTKDGKTLIQYPIGRKYTSFAIPSGTESISDLAFSDCYTLESVTIPDSTTYIGYLAFGWCDNLTSIVIPDGVTSIGSGAFHDCWSLASVVIGSGVTSISSSAFNYCYNLTSITIPNSVTSIGYNAFYGCDSLTSVTFENPNGWTANGTAISATDLSDTAKAAEYLKSTYIQYNWYRN